MPFVAPGSAARSRHVPAALIQVTPEWFWKRTALGDTVGSRLRSAVPAMANHRFSWDTSALGAAAISPAEAETLLRLPAAALTADAVEAFSKGGGYYDKPTAKKLEATVFSVGNSVGPDVAFRNFRGRDVDTDALMRDRGFPVK